MNLPLTDKDKNPRKFKLYDGQQALPKFSITLKALLDGVTFLNVNDLVLNF